MYKLNTMHIIDSAEKTLKTKETKLTDTILNFKCFVFSLHLVIRDLLCILVFWLANDHILNNSEIYHSENSTFSTNAEFPH